MLQADVVALIPKLLREAWPLLDLHDLTHVAAPGDTYLELQGRKTSPGRDMSYTHTIGVCMAWADSEQPPAGLPKKGDLIYPSTFKDVAPPQFFGFTAVDKAIYPQRVKFTGIWTSPALKADVY